jgi:hypothetical protein
MATPAPVVAAAVALLNDQADAARGGPADRYPPSPMGD